MEGECPLILKGQNQRHAALTHHNVQKKKKEKEKTVDREASVVLKH